MYILRSVIFFSLLIQSLAFSLTINQAVVKIGNQYITNLDICIAKNFYYYKLSLNDNEITDRLILIKAVLNDQRNSNINVSEDKITDYQESLIKDYGGLKNLEKSLRQYNLNFKQLRNYLKKYILYKTIKQNILLKKVIVKFSEIQDYYKNIYLINQKKYNLPIKPISEIAPLIESRLRSEKASKFENVWKKEILSHYKIEYLK